MPHDKPVAGPFASETTKQAPKPLAPLTVRAFGQKLVLAVTSDTYLRDDSYWRLRSIYEPALAAQTLAPTGTALDLGAGYGCFTIPFAAAFPGWTIWAFEPEPEAFAALSKNILAHDLTNVIPVNAAVMGSDASNLTQITTILSRFSVSASPSDMAAVLDLLPKHPFRRHNDMRGVIEAGPVTSDDFELCHYRGLPSAALTVLKPALVKLTTPFAETEVLTGLRDASLDHVIGEAWTHLASDLVYGKAKGLRQTWLPRAGDPLLRLRRSKPLTGHRCGLDVIVAMYNSRHWIQDCVDGILRGGSDEIRALVVDDGSTDGSGDVVRDLYANDDRVVLLSKLNGGCASARNFGRLHSDATHLTFVDADDIPGAGLFSGLLELARHTGAEIVQGGFDLLTYDPDGSRHYQPSYESHIPEIIHAKRHNFGSQTCCLVPSWLLTQGQPTIWRRIYRRDFLDNRNIWFPEHIRAFDDQIFQMLTLQSVNDVPMLDGVFYGYRQHPAQDIKQGDERAFYSLEMFRIVLKRGVSEGWNDFRPALQSYVNTVNWCYKGLRADLRPAFVRGAAELWVYATNTLAPRNFKGLSTDQFSPSDFTFYVAGFREKFKALDLSYGSIYLDSINMHPSMQSWSSIPETLR
ncbi:MAG: FkbM family methyltransferase [Alphaproteobacteria bacterium]